MTTKAKKKPTPVRLEESEESHLEEIAQQTGLSKSEVLRRACKFAFPKFLDRTVDISRVTGNKEAA